MKTIVVLLTTLLFHLQTAGQTQQTMRVTNATGTCVIANITPEKAKETALFNAKTEALKKAGIPENLLAEVTQMGEIFLEISNIEIGGGVTGYDIVSEDIKIVPEGNAKILISEIVINANVVKYNKERDPNFQLQVQGLKKAYKEKEALSFSVTPYQNGYLRIFLFEEDGAGEQLYPDKTIEPDKLFSQNVTVKFPMNDQYLYLLAKTDKSKQLEVNRILFLYTKDNAHFTGNTITLQTVLNWKAGIAPDRRTQVFHEFLIEQ